MTRSSRRGFGLVEIVLAIVVLGVMMIPFYSTFITTRETTFRSEMAYKAMQIAREELQEIRTLPLWGVPARPAAGNRPAIPEIAPFTGHTWRPVADQPIFVISSSDSRNGGQGVLPQLKYPPSYAGIETMCRVGPPPNATPEDQENVRIVEVLIRWQEKAEVVGEGGRKRAPALQSFHTVVIRR